MKQKYKNVVFFAETIQARIREYEYKKILKVVKKNRELFDNDSHFIRSAVNTLLREFDEKGLRLKK